MNHLYTAPRARLFTAFGTVLYVDVASGELRHGAFESSPGNAYFVADQSAAGPYRRGFLVQDTGESRKPIICRAESSHTVSRAGGGDVSMSPTVLALISLERGLIAFKAGDFFLSAVPDGRIVLCAPKCSTWELFLASEDWRSNLAPAENTQISDLSQASFDKKAIQSYIVHPSIRARANTKPKAKKVLIYGYTKWSHGRVYYDLCNHLHRRGYIVDILDWQVNHADYIGKIIPYYDLFMTACDGVRPLVDSYCVPYDKIIAVSHHEFDIRMLIEQKGIEVFDQFANYGVVSEYVYCASLIQGVTRVPMVASLGINYSEFHTDISERLTTVGYASSMSVTTYGVEWKRGDLAEAAAREAGLAFKVAGWTGNQISFHDMPDFYKSVDAVVTSSISEAAQLPVIEGAAAGRLVIGTPVGHFPLRAYQGGGIMAPIEADKFKAFTATTLRYYKENPAAYVAKCREIQEAARKFDWQYSIGEWIELIEAAKLSSGTPEVAVQGICRGEIDLHTQLRSSGQAKDVADPANSVSDLKQLNIVSEFRAVKSAGLSNSSALCNLMTSFGSDKAAPFHNYTVLYDRLFSQFRDKTLTIFELGLGTNKVGAPSSMGPHGKPGASLRGWRAYFPHAQIFGADIDADILFEEDRIKTFWVDQRDREAVRALWDRLGDVTFDIMIDDGLHEAAANIFFLMESFSKLKSGGVYVIEDVTPQDVEQMGSFVGGIASTCKDVIFEALEHPLNNVDNRLAIFHKAWCGARGGVIRRNPGTEPGMDESRSRTFYDAETREREMARMQLLRTQRARAARILGAITFHFDIARLGFLAEALRSLSEFPVAAMDVVIVTNTFREEDLSLLRRLCAEILSDKSTSIRSYGKLSHPFDLTWCHKAIIASEFVEKTDGGHTHFLYIEDDIRLSFANFCYFVECRERLRPTGLLPAFVRTEFSAAQGGLVASDAFSPVYVPVQPHVTVDDLVMANMPNPYNPCFILDRQLAEEYVQTRSFDRVASAGVSPWGARERAAMGLCFENVPMPFHTRYVVPISMQDDTVPTFARILHVPNNYANDPKMPLGKIRIDELFRGARALREGEWWPSPHPAHAAAPDRFLLVSHHDTIVYFDDTTQRIRHLPLGIAPLNLAAELVGASARLVVAVGDPPRERLVSFAKSDGTIGFPKDDEAWALTLETFADGAIGLRRGDCYVAADLDGLVRNDRAWCRAFEQFRLVRTDTIAGLAILQRHTWISRRDGAAVTLAPQPIDYGRERPHESSAIAATLAAGALELRRDIAFGPARIHLVSRERQIIFNAGATQVAINDGAAPVQRFSRALTTVETLRPGTDRTGRDRRSRERIGRTAKDTADSLD